MRNVHFYERQSFHPLLYVLAVGLGVFGLVMLVPSTNADQPIEAVKGLAGFFFLFVAVIIVNVMTMTTWVYDDEIRIQFGRLIPYYNKRIPLEKIASCCAVDFPPVRTGGGRGIRMGKFEGRTTGFLKARGSRGVLVETGDTPLLIGTQYADKLAGAIEQARHALRDAGSPA